MKKVLKGASFKLSRTFVDSCRQLSSRRTLRQYGVETLALVRRCAKPGPGDGNYIYINYNICPRLEQRCSLSDNRLGLDITADIRSSGPSP